MLFDAEQVRVTAAPRHGAGGRGLAGQRGRGDVSVELAISAGVDELLLDCASNTSAWAPAVTHAPLLVGGVAGGISDEGRGSGHDVRRKEWRLQLYVVCLMKCLLRERRRRKRREKDDDEVDCHVSFCVKTTPRH